MQFCLEIISNSLNRLFSYINFNNIFAGASASTSSIARPSCALTRSSLSARTWPLGYRATAAMCGHAGTVSWILVYILFYPYIILLYSWSRTWLRWASQDRRKFCFDGLSVYPIYKDNIESGFPILFGLSNCKVFPWSVQWKYIV